MDINFWSDIEKVQKAEEKKVYDRIEAEWGKSSTTLKNWLQLYYPFIVNNKEYTKKGKINADMFLPPRKGKLWTGEDALSRLKLAIRAEVIVIFSGQKLDETIVHIYKIKCLRLWTRINSLSVSLTFPEFVQLLKDSLTEVLNNWDYTVNMLIEKSEAFKYKRDQILYHYKREDFVPIRDEESMKAAYDKWIVEVWPTLLDKYKAEKLNEYVNNLVIRNAEQHRTMPVEVLNKLKEDYKSKLDKIRINKIKYIQFTKIIKKLREDKL